MTTPMPCCRSSWFALCFLLVMAPELSASRARSDAADVSGTWDMTVETQGSTSHPSIDLKQDGERVVGTYRGQMGSSKFEGTIKGTDIQFTVALKFQDASYTINYAGTVSDDTMKGTARFGDGGTADWTAKRRRSEVG